MGTKFNYFTFHFVRILALFLPLFETPIVPIHIPPNKMLSKCWSSFLIIALANAEEMRPGRRLLESMDHILEMGTTDEESYPCTSHEECPDSTFCYDGECDLCEECHYCHDGIDGTCGSCGDGYPLNESNCVTTEPTMELSLGAGDYVLDSRYVVSNKSMEWSEGNDYCSEQYGSSLATITNDEDAQILFNLTANTGIVAWTGMYVVDEEWKWVSNYPCDNDDCSTLEYWYYNEPSNTDVWFAGGCGKIGQAKFSSYPLAIDNQMVDSGCFSSTMGGDIRFQVVCDLMTWSSAPTPSTTTGSSEDEVDLSGALQLSILSTIGFVIGGFVTCGICVCVICVCVKKMKA